MGLYRVANEEKVYPSSGMSRVWIGISFLLALCVPVAGWAAEDSDPAAELPAIKVRGVPLERFSFRGVMNGNGPGSNRLILTSPSGSPVLLLGGVRAGDEIVKINGREVSEIKRSEFHSAFANKFSLVVKRRLAAGKFQLIETDGTVE